MNNLKACITRLASEHRLTLPEYEALVAGQTPELAAYAAELAREQRHRIYGKAVYVRGLIEIGNLCKNNCYYCGIRQKNKNCDRFHRRYSKVILRGTEYLRSSPDHSGRRKRVP